MEQHAVPQDITGFKFKLVGDMTLKQFGELAAGAILAYMFYASNWHPLLKWPFVLLFGFLGVALAFIPIEERPLDLWILNFIRAIYRPTLYVWKRDGTGSAYLASSNMTTKPPMPKPVATTSATEETNLGLTPWPFEKETAEPEITVAPAVAPPTPAPLSIEELQKLREQKLGELAQAKGKLQEATKQAKQEVFVSQVGPNAVTVEQLAQMRQEKVAQKDLDLNNQVAAGEAQLNILISQNKNLVDQVEAVKTKIGGLADVDTTQLKQQLDTLAAQKNDLSAKIATLQDQLAEQRARPLSQPAYQEPRAVSSPTPGVRVVNRPMEKQTTISLSDQPNVISGMVISEKGAPMEGAIVLIKDAAGNSIRALKTNRVGQFVVATPMENGKYYVELEKEGYRFSVLEITLDGKVIPPLEIPATK